MADLPKLSHRVSAREIRGGGTAASSVATTGRFLRGSDRASLSSFPPRVSVTMSLHKESASLYAAGSLSSGRRRHGQKGGGRGQ